MRFRGKARDEAEKPAPQGDSGLPALLRMVGRLIPSPPQRRLSYEDAIGWFVDHRPPERAAAHGAILRNPLPDGGTEVVQLYLDARHHLVCTPDGAPYGRRFVVEELVEELTEAFGGTQLLIVD